MYYQYRCKDCGKEFTKSLPVSERNNQKCPDCGSDNLHKFFGSVPTVWNTDGKTRGVK